MYLDYNGAFISANNLVAICYKENFNHPDFHGNVPGTLMICEDSVLIKYRAYLLPDDRITPSFTSYTRASDILISTAMMYGDSFPVDLAMKEFPYIEFPEDYFNGIRDRLPELFI